MIKRLKIATLSLLTIFSMAAFSTTAVAATAAQAAACGGAGIAATSGDCSGDANTPGVDNIIAAAIKILSSIVGLAAVVVIIVGGFKYITSGGDSNKVGAAKNTIMYALIGVVIAVMAQVLVRFVFDKATSTPPSYTAPPPTCSAGTCTYDPNSPGGTGGNGI